LDYDPGAWAWEPEAWSGGGRRIIDAAADGGIRRLYISLLIKNGRMQQVAAMGRFIRRARDRGLSIEAVEGDPRMVEAAGLAHALARAQAIAHYQAGAPADARLAAIQYDIEPYVLDSWGNYPCDHRGWAEAVRALARAVGEPVHLVLPFWVAADAIGRCFLEEVAGSVRMVTAMAYRTELGALTRAAEPLLAWGSEQGRPVRVALEAGPVPEEAKSPTALSLEKVAVVSGAAPYGSTGSVPTQQSRVSFLGNEGAMSDMARRAISAFAAWPSFAGISYHGLDWP
jgi:hypothetical protein